jgi:hypothetical protein
LRQRKVSMQDDSRAYRVACATVRALPDTFRIDA